jgi:hypothetical protein
MNDEWIDSHSVTCKFCGGLADERETVRLAEGEAHWDCFEELFGPNYEEEVTQ